MCKGPVVRGPRHGGFRGPQVRVAGGRAGPGEMPAGQSHELVRSPMDAAVFRTLTVFGQSLGSLSFDADVIRSHLSLLPLPLTPGRPKARCPGCSPSLTSFPWSLTPAWMPRSLLGVSESVPRACLTAGSPGRGHCLTPSLCFQLGAWRCSQTSSQRKE